MPRPRMPFNGDEPRSKRQRLEESGYRNHEYDEDGDEPRRKRADNNKPNHVLLFTISNPVYPITVEVLHKISAPIGEVQRIVIFKKNGVQAMVEFDSVESAIRAKEKLHEADIYPGCCTLKIDFAKPTKLNVYKNDAESWDYTTPTLESSPPAIVETRYENRCQLIQTHLDQLYSLATQQQHSARTSSQLIATISESRSELFDLMEPAQLADCMIIHQVARHFDRATKERWESFLDASDDYPTFEEFAEFIASRARTLERREADQNRPARPVHSAQPKSLRIVAQKASSRPSPFDECDCCGGRHYVVTCEKFRLMTPKERLNCVNQMKLCYNCLGRHSLKACRTTKGCRICPERHHTMLHGSSWALNGPSPPLRSPQPARSSGKRHSSLSARPRYSRSPSTPRKTR